MIMVTGATGTVGSEVVRQLLDVGQQVRALVRDRASAAGKLGDGVEIAVGDAGRPDTQPGHEGNAYDITGPEALSAAEQVKTISDEIGTPITHVDIPESAARESMIATGMLAEIVDALLEFMSDVRAGHSATVSDAVQTVTGQPARTFRAWVHDHDTAFN
jgi:uncharacterized protein YbjT (DUF2867 family)